MENHIENKGVIISGASRGIGRATAIKFASSGCHVALLGRNEEDLNTTRDSCLQSGAGSAHVIPCDLSDISSLAAVAMHCIEVLPSVDVLVNNAGIYYRGTVENAVLDDWDKLIDVNLRSVIHFTKYCIPALTKNPRSAIINIASIAAKTTFVQGSVYCASKHGLLGFAGGVFEDMRHLGVKVTTICPGFVNTGMVADRGLDPKKMIQVEDIAETVFFAANFPTTGCPTEIIIRPQIIPAMER